MSALDTALAELFNEHFTTYMERCARNTANGNHYFVLTLKGLRCEHCGADISGRVPKGHEHRFVPIVETAQDGKRRYLGRCSCGKEER